MRRSSGNGMRRASSNGGRNNSSIKPNNQKRRGQKKSDLDPALLIRKAKPRTEQTYRSDRPIEDLPVREVLKQKLLQKGFERPTEIQERTLEHLLDGRNLLGIAKTGTGKTGAFLIPIIEQLLLQGQHKPKQYALVVVPTRELALPVEPESKSMAGKLKLYSSCFIGGTNINRNIQDLRRPSHIVIGTPGRLLDLNKRGVLKLNAFRTLVLDEFDRMLDMGFLRDMRQIIDALHNRSQTMLFSATYDKAQKPIIEDILDNPVRVKVSQGDESADHIEQDIIRIKNGEDPFRVLSRLLQEDDFKKVLVFDETKHRVKRLCQKLNKAGFKSDQIHGNKSQAARVRALKAFKDGSINILVATDVAARGIDIDDISHVINYQVPKTFDSYIHRIGRTGRAGKAGVALTFVA